MAKVSIIIPVYNEEEHVQEAIQSALNQTYKDIEIVVIDDASTDNSEKKVLELAKKHSNIVFIKENVNLGVSLARNKAISIATGEYIFPLDADDKIEKTLVEKAAKVLDENPQTGVVYSFYKYFQDRDDIDECEVKEDGIIYDNGCLNGSMFRKEDFYKVGGYKTCFNRIGGEDWDLWLSFHEAGFEFKRIDEVLYYYRIDNKKQSMNKICLNNVLEVRRLMFKNHLELYAKDDNFVTRGFDCRYEKTKQRAIKYKKLFNLFLPIVIAQFVLNLSLILALIFKFRGLKDGLLQGFTCRGRRVYQPSYS